MSALEISKKKRFIYCWRHVISHTIACILYKVYKTMRMYKKETITL